MMMMMIVVSLVVMFVSLGNSNSGHLEEYKTSEASVLARRTCFLVIFNLLVCMARQFCDASIKGKVKYEKTHNY